MVRPSGDPTGKRPPPPLGATLSPVNAPPIAHSKFPVKLRGCAPAVRSITHRSGCEYERTGWATAPMKANCFPLGLTVKPPAPMLNEVSFDGSPPVTATEYSVVLGGS